MRTVEKLRLTHIARCLANEVKIGFVSALCQMPLNTCSNSVTYGRTLTNVVGLGRRASVRDSSQHACAIREGDIENDLRATDDRVRL